MFKKKSLLLVFIGVITVILSTSAQSLGAEDIERGKTLYDSYCIHCHGLSGAGDGPAANELNPKPRNFQNPDEMRLVTPEVMERAIVEGKKGTAMHRWSTILKPDDVKDIIEYIKSLMKESK